MNLAMNARDAMTAGGALTIETSRAELGTADRARHPTVALVAGAYVRLVVSDTGTGIAPEIRERIFEPFFTTKPVGRGTGLGLSTVYGIVKQSEGYVWVYSEPGQGTSMHVYLPADASVSHTEPPSCDGQIAEPAAGESPVSVPLAQPSSRASRDEALAETVLVAEDDPAVRGVAVRLLRDARYRVIEAASAEEALEAIGAASVDVLVTDIVMPGQDGVALATRLTRSRPSLRVVYMSGYPQSHLAAAGTLPGGNAFVDKPFTANALLAAVAGTKQNSR
jgi:two-component system cell cycle sensor histidine kinase/response regulator CckA